MAAGMALPVCVKRAGRRSTDEKIGTWALARFHKAREAARSRTGLSLASFLVAACDRGPQNRAALLCQASGLGLYDGTRAGGKQTLWDTQTRLGIVAVEDAGGVEHLVFWKPPAPPPPEDPSAEQEEPGSADFPDPDFAAGEREAFWKAYRRCRAYITTVVRGRLGAYPEPQHVVPPLAWQAFVKAWNRRHQLRDPDAWRYPLRHPRSWRPWLRKVVVRHVCDFFRRGQFLQASVENWTLEQLEGLADKGVGEAGLLGVMVDEENADAEAVKLLSSGQFRKVTSMDLLEYLKDHAPFVQVVDCHGCGRLLIGRKSLDWLAMQRKRDRERLGLVPVAGRLDGFSYCKGCLPELTECQGCGRDFPARVATAVSDLLYCPGCVDRRKAS